MENLENYNQNLPVTGQQDMHSRPERKKQAMCLGGTVEQVCLLAMAICVVPVLIFDSTWIKITAACFCFFAVMSPILIRVFRDRARLSAEQICSILKKRGLSPIIAGNEIRWTYNGKESVLRIHSSCQVEIAREYEIRPNPATIEGLEKAALETMKEVYLAKVSVRSDRGSSRLSFSTESLCFSAKELSAYLPMCLEILDLAEDRQSVHVSEIRDNMLKGDRHKIGFHHQDGEIR